MIFGRTNPIHMYSTLRGIDALCLRAGERIMTGTHVEPAPRAGLVTAALKAP